MNPDSPLGLFSDLLRTVLVVTGPLLAAALVAGILVGIVQTATQVNEASVSFLVKVIAVVVVLLVVGPMMASELMRYTRSNLEAVQSVVKK